MLRVYSVLYLQHVWARPLTVDSKLDEPEEAETVVDEPEAIIEEVPEEQVVVEEIIIKDETMITVEDTASIKEENQVELLNEREEIIHEQDEQENGMNTSSSDCSVRTETSVLPIRSETPMTHHDREYYDDDVTLSEDEEEIEDLIVQRLPHKFSPKQFLHRAKSTITEESVKKLGRRTSLFLEKINKKETSLPVLTPSSPLKGLKRQSSKLGKTFGKKLKRAISFHQA